MAELLGLVEGWRAEVLNARTIDDLLPKVMGRWFLDQDVDYGSISDLLARTDNAIADCREGPWEARKDAMADVPAMAPRDAAPAEAHSSDPPLILGLSDLPSAVRAGLEEAGLRVGTRFCCVGGRTPTVSDWRVAHWPL